ncbi:B12-binding domain-containing radical SAM protein [Candidatus Woesearchaeota archaeon]|nr:B12-binding domain-containing radical SAM protein [Candidatus Woesearchaeota archaeon]
MGLLRVGTAAKKAGYIVNILDAVFEGWDQQHHAFTSSEGSKMISYGLTEDKILRKIRSFNPHVVGISIDYTHQWGNARMVADLVKGWNEKTVVVMGGTHAHGLPGDVLMDSPSDYVVLGQADRTFVELLDAITHRTGNEVQKVRGIAYRKTNKVFQSPRMPFLSNIDEIAIPDISLINPQLYSGRFHSAGERVNPKGYLLYGFTSIGCNTNCTFCAIPPVQGPWVSMREQKFDEYLKYITQWGVTELLVEDDHLLHDPNWAMTVFRKLKEYKLPWIEEGGLGLFSLIALLPEVSEEFITTSTLRPSVFQKTLQAKRKGTTSENLIRAMAESGCYGAYLAVESANEDSLATSHKPKLNAQEELTTKIVSLLRAHGINTTCGLMLGFINPDGETYVEPKESISRTIAYGQRLKNAGASFINPFIFTPLPGAPHFENLRKYVHSNTDECFSHEFGTIDAPNGEWTRDELSLMRLRSLIMTEGLEGYRRMVKYGTWPVDNQRSNGA